METKRNPVGWFEIYVADMARARAFYEAVFAVKLEPLPNAMIEMLMFPSGDAMDRPGCAGALAKMDGCNPGQGGTLVYFSCEDCAVEAGRIEAAGGQVLKEKFSIGEYGFIAIATDTEGNTIGLHSVR